MNDVSTISSRRRHRWHVEQCWLNVCLNCVSMLSNIESTLCRHCLLLIILFTSFITSSLQYCTVSNQHCVYIAFSDILVHIVHIVDIAILYDIESNSCRHRPLLIFLFTSFTTKTSQYSTMSNQYVMKMIVFEM